jgi:hypothetical protein
VFSLTWRGTKYKGVDGGTNRPNEDQASQIVLISTIKNQSNSYKYPRFYSTNRGFCFLQFFKVTRIYHEK